MKNRVSARFFWLAILATIILLTLFCFVYFKVIAKTRTYKEITYDELTKLVDGDKQFILFIGSNNCSHCTLFKVTVNEVVEKYKLVINYIDISKLSDDEYAYINSNFAFSGTPTTVLVKSGDEPVSERVATKVKGAKSYEEFVNILKKNSFIKE